MNIIDIIAQDLFDKVRSRFTNLQMGNEDGSVTSDPKGARFFDFDFVLEGNNLGRVSISINERGSLKIFYSQGITEGTDLITRKMWYDFLREMRFFAKRRMMRFDTRDITKGNLNKDDFQYLAINGSKEANMTTESTMYGSSKTSYRQLENTRLIVRHSKAVNEEQPGARSRHINALFIENAEGERFKYPFIHLAGAKAMQRHVSNGGRPYDAIGESIMNVSEQISQLNLFKRYVNHNNFVSEDVTNITEHANRKLEQLRDHINHLQSQTYYKKFVENFEPSTQEELDEVTLADYKNKFTVQSFSEDLTSVFPLLHSIMKETNTIELDDVVTEGGDEESDEGKGYNAFEDFEQWADALAEGIMTPDQISQLRDIISSGLTLGPDGTSAIEALKGVGIDDPDLEKALSALANVDPNADPLETIEAWLQKNDPNVLTQLGGDQAEPEEPAPEEVPPAPEQGQEMEEIFDQPPMEEGSETMDNAEPDGKEKVNMKELAEFIGAFYNPHAREQGLGEWRKGPTELGIMAAKQFGDKAGRAVERMVTRMQERGADDHQFSEVMRLAGIQTSEGKKSKPDFLDVDKDGNKKEPFKKAVKDKKEKTKESMDIILKLAGLAK